MFKTIDDFIMENEKEWESNGSAKAQLQKLKNIIESGDKSFVLNDEEFGVYLNMNGGNPHYGGHNEKVYTLDVETFSTLGKECLENWWVPTSDGDFVDIWLLK